MNSTIRIGTRSSQLALWQTHYVQQLIEGGGFATEIVPIETKGDKILDRSLAKIGSKGVFTQELEDMLHNGEIDIAVHSAKDMQSELPEGLEIIAFTEREKVNDVVVSNNPTLSLQAGQPLVVGTSSTRRVAMLKRFYPHAQLVDMRGNLQTRMRKLSDGKCDALILAFAGVHRMEMTDKIVEYLPFEQFTPAVGQGSIAVEAARRLGTETRAAIRQLINHVATEACIRAERAYLRRLQGGCSVPIFALASTHGAAIQLNGGIVSLDGQTLLREVVQGPSSEAEALGGKLAELILSQGGDRMLADIKRTLSA